MTAATLTPAGAEVITEAQAVFTRARTTEWPEHVSRALGDPGSALALALKQYHDLERGIVPPWFPGMRPGPEGKATALRLAADNVWERAEEVAAVIAEHYAAEEGAAA